MTDPNDIVERLRKRGFATREECIDEILRLRQLVAELTPPQWAQPKPPVVKPSSTQPVYWTPEQMADPNGMYAQLRDEAAAFSRANAAAAADWCSPPPSDLEQASDAADEAHARLQAIADSHETLTVKWGVQYAEMIRNGRTVGVVSEYERNGNRYGVAADTPIDHTFDTEIS